MTARLQKDPHAKAVGDGQKDSPVRLSSVDVEEVAGNISLLNYNTLNSQLIHRFIVIDGDGHGVRHRQYWKLQLSRFGVNIQLVDNNNNMVFHLPSALVGSALAGCGFLLIHRELSHRRRLTTKWVVQEYAEEQWKEWRKQVADDAISESTKVRERERKTQYDVFYIVNMYRRQLIQIMICLLSIRFIGELSVP